MFRGRWQACEIENAAHVIPVTQVVSITSSLGSAFYSAAQRYPDRAAVITPDGTCTYAALWALAGRYRYALNANGISPGEPVAVACQNPVEAAAAVWAVLLEGGIVVFLDFAFPIERLRYILNDVGAACVLADDAQDNSVAGLAPGIPVVRPSMRDARVDEGVDVRDDRVASLFYTSGSTGWPKGVMLSHRAILHEVSVHVATLNLRPADRFSALYSLHVAGSNRDFFAALTLGAAWCPFPFRQRGARALADWVRDAGITCFHAVPAVFRETCRALEGRAPVSSIHTVYVAGDRVEPEDAARCFRHFGAHTRFYTGLGCSETSSIYVHRVVRNSDLLPTANLPCGAPIPGVTVALVDEHRRPVADGEEGEIAVSGAHLASGYWKREELTKERFAGTPGEPGHTYYTGDFGAWDPNGHLLFLGRRDDQVKISGVRVELGEVERALRSCSGVSDVAAVPKRTTHSTHIAAFLARPNGHFQAAELRAALGRYLPAVAVPSELHVVPAIPRLASGKPDRRALLQWVENEYPAAGDEPLTDYEQRVADIWRECIPHAAPIRRETSFAAAGGHSLQAVQMAVLVKERLGVTVSAEWVQDQPSLGEFAKRLQSAAETSIYSIRANALARDEQNRLRLFVAAWEKFQEPSRILADGVMLSVGSTRSEYPPLVWIYMGGQTHAMISRVARLRQVILLPSSMDLLPFDDATFTRYCDFFVPLLREHLPPGPVEVGGFCNNGVIACHLARALQRTILTPARVVLIDTVAFPTIPRWTSRIKSLLTFFRFVLSGRWVDLCARVARKARALATTAPPRAAYSVPIPSEGRLALIWSAEFSRGHFFSGDNGWRAARPRYAWRVIGKKHLECMNESNLRELVSAIVEK